MTTFFLDGLGGTSGDRTVTERPLSVRGDVWYVHYGTGTDAVSPRGKERSAPLKTLAGAFSNSAPGDIIVCLSGHAEVITSALLPTKVTIIGEGISGGIPQVTFQKNVNADAMFNIVEVGVQFRNIRFLQNAIASATENFTVSVDGVSFIGCRFEMSDYNNAVCVKATTANFGRIERCTFVSTALGTPPSPAFTSSGDSWMIVDTIFDGGTIGFLNGLALIAGIDNMRLEGITLLGGADISVGSGTGWVHAASTTSSGRVVW